MMKRLRVCADTHASYSSAEDAENLTSTSRRCASSSRSVSSADERSASGQLDQDAEREAVVNHRLADVEHAHAVAREDRRQRERDAGTIVTGDADQERA